MLKNKDNARRWGVLVLAVVTMTLSACGDATDSNNGQDNNGTSGQTLEVEGSWVDNYGTAYTIDDQTWGNQAVIEFDNQENFAVTEGEDFETGEPAFSKVVWTEPADGEWWYCTVDFGLDSAEAALNTEKSADASNPSESGCGDFPWTQMRVPIEVTGTYMNQFDSMETVTATTWDFGIEQSIVDWDNQANWAITQNPEDAEFNPSAFNKIVWLEPNDQDVFFYCTVDFGLETEEAARTTAKTADSGAPLEGGCGESPWTELTPMEG